MDNASKALYIAGSLLIAVLVISLLVYSFDKFGVVEEQKDEIAYQESITSFNREYEAYNKRIMYGVDVISCINKAISNNEKYVKGGKWALGGASGEEAVVDIQVLLKNDLKESFKIYHMNDKNDKESVVYQTSSEAVYNDFKNNKYLSMDVCDFFDVRNDNLLSNESLKTMAVNVLFEGNGTIFVKPAPEINLELEKINRAKISNIDSDYNNYFFMDLMEDSRKKHSFTEGTESLRDLVSHATELEIVRVNDSSDSKVWSSVKWTTVLSDFKKRKFKCEEITYNEDTGRVENMLFVEK